MSWHKNIEAIFLKIRYANLPRKNWIRFLSQKKGTHISQGFNGLAHKKCTFISQPKSIIAGRFNF
jgi:hypothetical protein